MREKVLITGASGFVGGYLVSEALNRGLEVYAGIRSSSSTQYLVDPRIHLLILDFNDDSALTSIIKEHDFDYIIHNAGLTAAPSLDQLIRVNKGTLTTLINSIRKSGINIKKLIYTSSLAAYGPADNQSGDLVELEDTPHPITNYGRSKLIAEQYLIQQEDIPYIIIRPTAVYGPRDMEFLPVYKSANKGLSLLIGKEKQFLTFIYVEDLARFFLDAILSNVIRKSYFITDGHVYDNISYNLSVAKALNSKTINIKLPIQLVKIIAWISEKTGQLRGHYPVLNLDKVEELKSRSWACNVDAVKKDFNFAPAFSLDTGLEKTISWCKRHKLL